MKRLAADRRKWVILSVMIISLVAVVLDNTVLNIALKTISEPRAGLGPARASWNGRSTPTRWSSPGCCSPSGWWATGSGGAGC